MADQPVPAAPAAESPAAKPAPPLRDVREDLMPGDPLGARLGGESLSAIQLQDSRVMALARGGAAGVVVTDEELPAARRREVALVALVVGVSILAAVWLYRRNRRVNFAGQERNLG